MFVVVDVKDGSSYFEVPGINKYCYVGVVSVEDLTKPVEKNNIAENNIDEDRIVDEDDIVNETGEEEE
jgi:hypothetical protein